MSNIIFGLIFVFISVWVYFQARRFPYIPGYPGPGFFPTIVAFALFTASLCLIGVGIKNILKDDCAWRRRLTINFSQLNISNFVSVVIMILVYLFLSPRIGFFFSSALILFLLMLKMKTRIWQAFIIAFGVAALLRVVFQDIFKVPLPYGLLPGGW